MPKVLEAWWGQVTEAFIVDDGNLARLNLRDQGMNLEILD